MKKIIFAVMALSASVLAGCQDTKENPLLGEFNTPFQTPPFDLIKTEHYMPAFEEGIKQSRAEIDSIVNNSEPPTFRNTIEALERQGELLGRTATIFFALNGSNTSPQMQEVAQKVQPMLTELGNDISLNEKLFARVKEVYENEKDSPALDKEQKMLLEKTYKGFTRSGADLNDRDKEEYRKISSELGNLTLEFGNNVLAATNEYTLNIPAEDSAKVTYMPDFVKAAMAETAAERGEQGWTVTLQFASLSQFLTYSKERDLKEQVWKASNSKCYTDGDYDNRDNIKRITELRMKMANLLGYATYADYVLEERMAENTATVMNFLNELLVPTKKWADEEYMQIKEYAKQLDGMTDMMPWDFAYYSEKFKTEKYQLNDELIKPYLRLESVEEASFMLAEKLYGVTFTENKEIQIYHPDAKAYEVHDTDGKVIAILYVDYFPRASKRGGAWMTTFRDSYTKPDGEFVIPVVTLNYNFTKPTADTPSLLTFYELTTILHEFGHGLHGIFGKGKYASLTGTEVYRDFVELPSQLMENWGSEEQFLDMFAKHYLTGEKMPKELIEKIRESKNFMSAYANVRQLSFGFNDMAWHTITKPVTEDVAEFERKAMAATQVTPYVDGTSMATSFTHIFSGGYAAGYYGYKWAEVLEADAFSLFQEKGIFNREVAESFRKNILEKGGSEHPMDLYVNFRGHKPEPKALVDKILHGRQ